MIRNAPLPGTTTTTRGATEMHTHTTACPTRIVRTHPADSPWAITESVEFACEATTDHGDLATLAHDTVDTTMAAYLRVQAHLMRLWISLGRPESAVEDILFQTMDTLRDLGQDDLSEGVATLVVDVLLARVTGSGIPNSLDRLAGEIHPA